MLNSLIGVKLNQAQTFTDKGQRMPVTRIQTGPCCVVRVKTTKTDGYNSLQLGFGIKRVKVTSKPILGMLKKAGVKNNPRFFREIRVGEEDIKGYKAGQEVKLTDVFKPGDLVDVIGTSKGKGFAGVVKKWGFKGGPRTHGQSDRERAPGSIGSTTTPGRVLKGKRMAGKMGNAKITIKNLEVLSVDAKKNLLEIKGLVPGNNNGSLVINKVKDGKGIVEVKPETIISEVAEAPVIEEEKAIETEMEIKEDVTTN